MGPLSRTTHNGHWTFLVGTENARLSGGALVAPVRQSAGGRGPGGRWSHAPRWPTMARPVLSVTAARTGTPRVGEWSPASTLDHGHRSARVHERLRSSDGTAEKSVPMMGFPFGGDE